MLTLKCLLDVNSFLCASLKVRNTSFGLAESHGAFLRNLDISKLRYLGEIYHSLLFFNIDLVSKHNLNELDK
jgi:hypothetical protein